MKIKLGCLLILILIGILAIGIVSASENITLDKDNPIISSNENSILTQNSEEIESINDIPVLTQNNDNKIESGENNILSKNYEHDISSSNNVDLRIVGLFREYKYRHDVVLMIAVVNYEGTSHNTKANIKIDNGLNIIYFEPSKGTYNKNTGVWTIGDLNEGKFATLQIHFKVNKNTYFAKFNVVTDSNDFDQSNNHGSAYITIKGPKSPYIITGNHERNYNAHRGHYLSSGSGLVSRSVTKSANLTQSQATSVEKPTGNPILLLLFSIALMGLRCKHKKS